MSLNPKTIKALFSKLKPAQAVNKFPTLASGALETARDMGRIIDNVNPNALPVKNAGNVLKKALDINPTLMPHSIIETNPLVRRRNQKFWEFYEKALPSKQWSDIPETVSNLGDDVLREGFTRRWENPTSSGIKLSTPLPTKELVVSGESVIPHSNTALGRYYRSRMSNIDPVHKNPPLKKLSTFRNSDDYYELVDYLDTEDMLKRVKDATYGDIPGISDSDAFLYVNKMPNLEYVDPNTVEYLHNALSKRYDTSKKLQSTFGRAPGSFASNDEYSNAIASLFNELNKIPF